REQVLRVCGALLEGRSAVAQHLLRDLLHTDRAARAPHRRRDCRDAVSGGSRRRFVEAKPRAVRQPRRIHGPLLAIRRSGLDLPVPRVVSALGDSRMHSDQDAIKKSIRSYGIVGGLLLLFTAITVAANQVHLAIPLAIAVALIIATMKGSMVAAVFMHLSHE